MFKVGFIREVQSSNWLSNTMVVSIISQLGFKLHFMKVGQESDASMVSEMAYFVWSYATCLALLDCVEKMEHQDDLART